MTKSPKRKPTRRNPVARALQAALFRQRTKPSGRKYKRKSRTKEQEQ